MYDALGRAMLKNATLLTAWGQKDGGLELHVPQKFTTSEPAIGFSLKSFDCTADQHPLGKTLPHLSSNGTTQKFSADIAAFSGIPDIPRSVEEVMQQDGPQLYLHVTVFADATVVSLAWPHYLMDAMGLQALVHNWSLVVNGEANKVATFLGADKDPLQEAIEADSGSHEELAVEKHSLGAYGTLMLVLGLLWASFWASKMEERRITLSPASLERLCQRARKDVAENGEPGGFISEGDVMVAWAAHMFAGSQPKARSVTVASIANARFRLRTLQANKERSYLHNMLLFGYSCFAAGFHHEPLGRTALSHRQQLAEQCTEQQMLGYFRMQREQVAAKGKMRILFGTPGSVILMVNNLAKVDLFQILDFSGAVIRPGESGARRQNPPGAISYYHPITLHDKVDLLSYFRILGRDHSGNYLLEGIFQPATWTRIVEDLEQLQSEKAAQAT